MRSERGNRWHRASKAVAFVLLSLRTCLAHDSASANEGPSVVLILSAGGQMTGRVPSIDAETLTLLSADGAALRIRRAGLGALVLRAVERFGPEEAGQDIVTRLDGDRLYGHIETADEFGLQLDLLTRGAGVRIPWSRIARVDFARDPVATGPLQGDWIRLEFEHPEGSDPGGPDWLECVLAERRDDTVVVEAPYVGRLTLPPARIHALNTIGASRRYLIDPHPHHLGDRDVPDLDPTHAEGDTLERRFALDAVPRQPAALVVDVVQLVGLEGTPVLSALVREGELRTELTLNGIRLPDLNTGLNGPNPEPRRIRVAIPDGALHSGENLLRIEQRGASDDPKRRDNFGFRNLAIEWPLEEP